MIKINNIKMGIGDWGFGVWGGGWGGGGPQPKTQHQTHTPTTPQKKKK